MKIGGGSILIYSSFILLTNSVVGIFTSNYVYSFLFATLFITSICVHTQNNIAINLLDKFVILLIFLYGGYRLREKMNMSLYGIIKNLVIISTCLCVIWFYCYGYIAQDLCFHPIPEIATIYHIFMHIIGSLGHNMIMLY